MSHFKILLFVLGVLLTPFETIYGSTAATDACNPLLTEQASFFGAPSALEPHTEAFFEAAKARVLAKLTGQRRAINQFFDYLKAWYLTPPEYRQAPMIVLAAGMTGVGKTTVALSALEELNLLPESFYFHVEKYAATNAGAEGFGYDLFRTVETQTEMNGIEVTSVRKLRDPVIILDEMQKLNTRDAEGKPAERPQANQIFEFLGNNGRLRIRNPMYDELKHAARRPSWYMDMPEDFKDKDKTEKKAFLQKSRAEIEALLEQIPPQIQLDFSNGLVLIMLNLDNVYVGSNISNPDTMTADEIHERTSRISATNIRAGLLQLWRPEHVRRLGTRYISFATFSEAEFREQMDKELDRARDIAKSKYGMTLTFSDALTKRIYNEGVIPTQGMVPLIDTVTLMATDPLPTVYARFRSEIDRGADLRVEADVASDDGNYSEWKVTIDGNPQRRERFLIPSDYKNSLDLRDEPLRSHVAIRLAARVAAGIKIHKIFPELVRANSRSHGQDGLVQFQIDSRANNFKLRSEFLELVFYDLAPFVMEQMIFGESSLMSAGDLKNASSLAKTLATSGMAQNNLSTILREPPGRYSFDDTPERIQTHPQLRSVDLERQVAEMIESLRDTFEKLSNLGDKTPALLSGDRSGLESDMESILKEVFLELIRFLKEQRSFVAALAMKLTQTVEVENRDVEAIFRDAWAGDKSFVNNSKVTAAQRFLADPQKFEFKQPSPQLDRLKLH